MSQNKIPAKSKDTQVFAIRFLPDETTALLEKVDQVNLALESQGLPPVITSASFIKSVVLRELKKSTDLTLHPPLICPKDFKGELPKCIQLEVRETEPEPQESPSCANCLKNRTSADKWKAVEAMLKECPSTSSHSIAEMLQVSATFVLKVRNELKNESLIQTDFVTGKDGKSYKMRKPK